MLLVCTGLEELPSASRPGSFLLLAHAVREARPNGEADPEGASAWRESKKRTKENGLPRRSETATGCGTGIFRLVIPDSVGKRRTSCASPFGSGSAVGFQTSSPFPFDTLRGVFQQNAFVGQLFSDRIGAGEIAGGL